MEMSIEEIKKYLPHRYPFLLVDWVEELKVHSHVVAHKNVTHNEPCFLGHFPSMSIMPGVLTLEGMAQAAGILSAKTVEAQTNENNIYLLVAAEKVRYKKPIFPGDSICFKVKVLKEKRGIWKYEAVAIVKDQVACEAIIFCKGGDKNQIFASA